MGEKTPENLNVFESGAVRGKDADNERWDLIPPLGLKRVAKTCKEGADRYGEWNWAKGLPRSNLLNHAIRHLFLLQSGDRIEDHLAHAAWNLLAALHFEETGQHKIDEDDF